MSTPRDVADPKRDLAESDTVKLDLGAWRECAFGELCDITRGASPRPIHEWISSDGIPWIKISDASGSKTRVITQTKERIRPDGRAKSVSVAPGDLILSNSATPGIPKFVGINACIHDGWLLLRNLRDIDPLFCYYLLLFEKSRIVRRGTGSVFTNLKTDILKSHSVRIPSLGVQRAIARVLGALDNKIELNRCMNETLEAIAQAVFKDWFVDFGPVRAKKDGRQPYLASEIWHGFPTELRQSNEFQVPNSWSFKPLRECFNLTMGQSPPGKTYNDVGDGVPFFQGRKDFGFRYPENRRYCTAPSRIARSDDTLVSVRAPVGDINMAWSDCCIGRGVASLRHHSTSSSYTYYAIRAINGDIAEFEHSGTVFGAITRKQFEDLRILEPDLATIHAFDALVSPLDNRIRLNVAASHDLTVVRDTLLPKLLSGEICITDAEKVDNPIT